VVYPCPVNPPSGECPYDGETCSYDGECGTTCECEGGEWGCFGNPCPPPLQVCPSNPPTGGTSCAGEGGETCDYSNGTCEGEQCSCDGSVWSCSAFACPPPPPTTCPTFPPTQGTACSAIGDDCVYYVNGECNQESCECFPSGSWSCSYAVGCPEDAGP
jgi:hypothetical protein